MYERENRMQGWSNKFSPLHALKSIIADVARSYEQKHSTLSVMRDKIFTYLHINYLATVRIHTKEILQLKRRLSKRTKLLEIGLTLSMDEIVEVKSLKKNDYLKTHIHLIEILKCIVELNTNETLPLWQAPWDHRLRVGYISICSSRPWSIYAHRPHRGDGNWTLATLFQLSMCRPEKTPVLRWLEGWVNGDLRKQGICRAQFWMRRVG